MISYPGDIWEVDLDLEATYERKPDLAVERIEFDPYNHVSVTIVNNGPVGWIHKFGYPGMPASQQ